MKYKILTALLFLLNTTLFSQCWVSIAGGTIHSLAIASDSTMWSWGDNSGGQLGDGTNTSRNEPAQIGDRKDWVSVSAGFAHSVALTKSGMIYTWGFNTRGQLGNGTENMQTIPQAIPGKWRAVTSGASHVVAIKSDGTLWAWGSNQRVQSGRGDDANQTTPLQISSDTNWVAITAGYYDGIALNNKGELYGWGHGGNPQDWAKLSIPTRIGTDNDWTAVSAGLGNTVAVKSNGTLWTWSSPGIDGNTGNPYWEGRISQVGTNSDWKKISAGYNYVLATKTNNTLWAWGSNSDGQIGDGTSGGTVYSPQQIGSANNWLMIEAGDFHGMAMNSNNKLATWGANGSGQLGVLNSSIYSPQEIACPDIRIGCWTSLSVGDNHAIALKDDGSLWSWGNNYYGQLGDGTNLDTIIPIPIAIGETWKTIAAGVGHNLAIHEDGSVWGWGANTYGELGIANNTNSSVPVKINSFSDVVMLLPAATCSLVKKSNDDVYGAGSNTYGTFGNGTMVGEYNEFTFSHNIAWKNMAISGSQVFAIKNDGTLWEWGSLNTGTPFQVGTDSDWKVIKTSGFRHVALKTDGSLWCWGQFHDNTASANPVRIGSDNDWKEIATGDWYTLMLKNDGTMWTFGANKYGVGNGTVIANDLPVQLGNENNWLHVYANAYQSFALKKNGRLWAWGYNKYGKLGINNRTDQTSPVEVLCSNDFYTSVSIVNKENELKIYPNPTHDILFIQGLKNNENTVVKVFDVLGNVLLIQANTQNIDLHNLAAGVYFLSIETSRISYSPMRFVKQ